MDRAVPVGAHLTRRRLLQSGGVALVAVAVGELPALASPARGAAALRRSTFAPLVGDEFMLDDVRVQLAAVDRYGRGRARTARDSDAAFVLIFHAPKRAPRLEQAVMTIRHPRIGAVELLVSPAGTGRRGLDYTAVVDTRRAPRART